MNRRLPRFGLARRGLTIIEVLVSLGVVSLLLALLSPAVLQSRESARRLQCQSNLHQLGLAANAHEAAHRRFPFTSQNGFNPGTGRVTPAISPLSSMLAFLDQSSISNRIDFADNTWVGFNTTINSLSPQNQALLQVGVPVFRCPCDKQHNGTNYRANMGPSPFTYWVTQMGCASPGPKPNAGAFVNDRGLTDGEFRDGLANTVFFSERIVGDGIAKQYDPWRDIFLAQPAIGFCSADQVTDFCSSHASANAAHYSSGGFTWLFGGWPHTWYHHLMPPNSPIPDCSDAAGNLAGGLGLLTSRSEHRGGVNVVLGDASVRFVSDQVDLAVWQALATRAGADAVSE